MNKPSRTVATNTELNTRSVATQTIGDHSESEVSNTQKSSAEKKAAKRRLDQHRQKLLPIASYLQRQCHLMLLVTSLITVLQPKGKIFVLI